MTQGKAGRRLKGFHVSTLFFSATIWIFIPCVFQPTLDRTNRICVYHICDFLICVCCILLPCSPSACCLFKLRQRSESYAGGGWGDGVRLPIPPFQITALLPRKGICPSIPLTVPDSMGLRPRAGGRFRDDEALFKMHQHPCVADIDVIKSSYLWVSPWISFLILNSLTGKTPARARSASSSRSTSAGGS